MSVSASMKFEASCGKRTAANCTPADWSRSETRPQPTRRDAIDALSRARVVGIWNLSSLRTLSNSACRHSFKFTSSPTSSWKFGDGLPEIQAQWKSDLAEPRKTWDMAETSPIDTYKLLTSAIVPRPIAFVSSLSSDGIPNLAPMSYFSMVSHNPPLVSISFALSKTRPKDTRENILATKEFTVSIISEPFVEAANATSVEAPANIDEWLVSGLTPEPSSVVKPALVKESAVSMECELYSHQDILNPHPTTTIVLGRIKKVHVRPSVLHPDGNRIDPDKLRPLARMGGLTYAKIIEGFDLPRINWKGAPKDEILELLRTKST